MIRVLVVIGTRPEAIKLAPVIEELRRDPSFSVSICVTGQHREMLAQVLELFGIVPDVDLELMKPGQTLSSIAAGVLTKMPEVIRAVRADVVIVQGDTTTAFAAGLAAYYEGIDVAHVEAGLRSGDLSAPWPEEANRRLLSVFTRFHFAPTEDAKANLVREGTDPGRILVTGNTVIDALRQTAGRIAADEPLRSTISNGFPFLSPERRLILTTAHRRESFGGGLDEICKALAEIADAHDDVEIVFPVHLNPLVREPVNRILSGRKRIHLIEPVGYLDFVYLLMRSELVLSDSGGVQEEASTLGRPVLVLRETTERPEGLRSGNMILVGTKREGIVAEAATLLGDAARRATMSRPSEAFGDGRASARIAARLRAAFALH